MMKIPITLFCLGALIFQIISCDQEPLPGKKDIAQKNNSYNRTNNNALLSGKWVIEDLVIPDCKLCKRINMRLNKLWENDLDIGDSFLFTADSLIYNSATGQQLKERFQFHDSVLVLQGFDWVYPMKVKAYTGRNLTLSISQTYVSEMNSNEGPKDLIVKLSKTQ
jgi:hypothetical protein